MTNQSKSRQEQNPTDRSVWGEPVTLMSAPAEIKLSATSAANSLSVIFTPGVIADLQGSGPLCATQAVSFRAPVRVGANERLIGYLNDLSISVNKSPGARAMVTVDLAGATKSWEFSPDFPEAEPLATAMKRERIFSVQGLEKASVIDLGLVGPASDYYATLVITAQRRNEQEFALVTIDSLDIVAHITF